MAPPEHAFTTTVNDFRSNLWGHHLVVSDEIAQPFIEGENRRVICTLNNDHTIQAALMPNKGAWFILLNKEVRDKLGLTTGDEVQVRLIKDESTYGMEMPEELQVLLEQDEMGRQRFESFTPGKQRSLIYIVKKMKRPESRLSKALAIVDYLRSTDGPIDFKALNEVIKKYNQRAKGW